MSKKTTGKIDQWNDDRGFGFIKKDGDFQRIFFHISKITTHSSHRPKVGERVSFQVGYDQKKRMNAYNVAIDGVSPHRVTPRRINFFDCILILIIILTLLFIGFTYWESGQKDLDLDTLMLGIPAIISFALLSRDKKPKETHYCCASCHGQYKFNKRTIRAWNNGITRFYCKNCYQPRGYVTPTHHKNMKGIGMGGIALILIIGLIAFSLVS